MLDHKHLILNANVKKPPTNTEHIIEWLKKLVEIINMKLVLGPYAHYCTAKDNEGLAAICAIETSHCSIHVWDKGKIPYLRFDIYSCSCFDVEKVIEHLKEFEPTSYEWKLIDRNDKIFTLCSTYGQM